MLAFVMLALIPLAREIDSVVTLGIITVLLAGLITIETRGYGETRSQFRHDFYVG